MSRIEKVMAELSELRSFYFKIKNRHKSHTPQDGTILKTNRVKNSTTPLQRTSR
jgi:phosphatidylserine decarboxylase